MHSPFQFASQEIELRRDLFLIGGSGQPERLHSLRDAKFFQGVCFGKDV